MILSTVIFGNLNLTHKLKQFKIFGCHRDRTCPRRKMQIYMLQRYLYAGYISYFCSSMKPCRTALDRSKISVLICRRDDVMIDVCIYTKIRPGTDSQ